MFRIDAFPFANSAASEGGKKKDDRTNTSCPFTTIPTMHGCVASCLMRNDEDENTPEATVKASKHRGVLITIGRKGCDVTFDSDKCVSRSHCRVRLIVDPDRISLPHKIAGVGAISREGIENIRDAFKPMNEDELQACKDSACGTAVVLDDLGSKFGTYILEDDEKVITADAPGKDVGEDEETDNEDAVAASQLAATQKLPGSRQDIQEEGIVVNGVKMKRRKLKPNSSLIMHDLGQPIPFNSAMDANSFGGSSSSIGVVTIFTGISGSRVTITRLPSLTFCFTRVDAALRDNFALQTYQVGGMVQSSWDSEACTHLVCPKLMSTAKALAAWASRKPIVTPEFIAALMKRKTLTDVLPQEDDYLPHGDLGTDNVDPHVPRNVLKNCLLISLVDDEIEQLCRAAGAHVVPSYCVEDDLFFGDQWLKQQIHRAEKEGRLLAFVDSADKKVKKKGMHLTNVGIARTNGREIAISIAELKPLKDDKGEGLRMPSGKLSDGVESVAADSIDNVMVIAPVESIDKQTKEQTGGAIISSKVPTKNVRKFNEGGNLTDNEEMPEKTSEIACTSEHGSPHRQRRKRNRLLTSKHGWLVTASQKNRDAYRTYRRDANNEIESEFRELAAPKKPTCQSPKISDVSTNISGAIGDDEPNFKRFRKNMVAEGQYRNHLLKAVLPKESERQRQLDLSQREIEEEERIADSLFNEPGRGRLMLPKAQTKGRQNRRAKV